ncbi:hypothetical protein [Caldalkalibacillus mannanilyticus]|uniref:hypothetical protein n=1 Tax=Caldalkalibacillus mannanilyticus TaxID=1418 RepID=UPI0004692E08|nr:hypothetical protein [Caldalkalibacillus mannanilyticus]
MSGNPYSDIVNQLSSVKGDKTQESNLQVAQECLSNPNLLNEIAEGLHHHDPKIVGDCAEVFTKIAEKNSQIVLPFVDFLFPLLQNKTTRARWEAMHTISIIAADVPEMLNSHLDKLEEIIRQDSSTIVRDYAIDALNYFSLRGEQEAQTVYPLLIEALDLWDGKHRGRILRGFMNILSVVPELACEIKEVAQKYTEYKKGVVRKAAQALIKI